MTEVHSVGNRFGIVWQHSTFMNFRLPSGLGLFDKVGNAQFATSCLAVFVHQGCLVLARVDLCM